MYFGPVEIRIWQIVGQEQVITYPHASVKLVNGSTTAAASYLHRDVLGSVRAITDAAGVKVWSGYYKPFGEQTPWQSISTCMPEAKGWIGERYDASAGFLRGGKRSPGPFPDPRSTSTRGITIRNWACSSSPTGSK